MPRKGKFAHSYEDEYDDSYDYNEEYEYDYGDAQVGSPEYEDESKIEDLKEQKDVWRCLSCTYDNQKNCHACDMCGMVRSSSVNGSETDFVVSDGPKVKSLNKQEDVWCCLNCTYDNSKNLSACDMCGTARTSSLTVPSLKTSDTSFGILTKAPAASSNKVNYSNGKAKNTDNGVHRKDGSSSKGRILEESQTQNFSSSSTVQKSNANVNKSLSMKEYKPEPWILQEQSDMGKNILHLAIVGHVDAGKSTLMGRFLYIMGRVSQKEMHKYEREAKQKGKGSFSYAWVLDESPEERERGVTMTVAVAHFETNNFHVVLLDSPGHKDFVPNMIVGASQADAAVLVVDASVGAFEAGMDGQGIGGQTKEHAQLIRSFGVEQLIVAVNKMDAIAYSKERFDFIKSQLGTFLRRCGFKECSLTWIPMSVIENQNLVVSPTNEHLKSWYKGPNLLEAIDLFKLPTRDTCRPLRLPISEVIQSRTLGQVAVSGKLEAGAIRIGTKVLVMPLAELATVKAIEQDGKALNIAKAGDSVDIGLQGVDSSILMPGGILCHPDFPVPVANCIELKVAVLDIRKPILFGAEVELHAHHAKESARVAQILAILDPKTGMVRKKAPRCLTANQSALIQVSPGQGICIEEYSNYKALGRVTLRADGKTIAVGVVTRIIEQ